MAAMTEGTQLQNYAQRLRSDLDAIRSHGTEAMQELVAKNKAQVETIKHQVSARHRCIHNLVRAACAREERKYYDGTSDFLGSPQLSKPSRKVEIDLSECLIDDELVSLIVKTIQSSSRTVHSLNLSGNIITDRGARRLSMYLEKFGRVRHLDLRKNKISAAGTT